MSIVKDISRGLAPYLVLAGIAGVIWLYRDKIATWLWQSAGQPIQQATAPVAEAVNRPIPGTGGAVSPADVAQAMVPGVGIGSIWEMIQRGWETISGSSSNAAPSPAVISPVVSPLQEEVSSTSSYLEETYGSDPAYRQRGTSLLGAPLFAPVTEQTGWLETQQGELFEVWNMAGTYMLRSGDFWLGPNISSCYLQGGTWNYAKGVCDLGVI